MMAMLLFEWRGHFENPELNALHADAFDHPILQIDWIRQVQAHSLGWMTARDGPELIGFINVAWDGGIHAFLLDTVVSRERRRQGVGTKLVAGAVAGARAARCEWLHVDFDNELRPFYVGACGFKLSTAGLIAL